jgi:Flp pilus assembly protein TadG
MIAPGRRWERRGGVAVFVMVCLTVVLGMAALVIDIGQISNARTELQVAADAAALAGTNRLLEDRRLKGTADLNEVIAASRTTARSIAGQNEVLGEYPAVDLNGSNDTAGDIVVGYIQDPTDRKNPMVFTDSTKFNSVQVHVRKNTERNGAIAMMFARIFGKKSADSGALGTATFQDGVVGFRVTDGTPFAGLVPFALRESYWQDLVGGTYNNGDNYTYDPDTGEVTDGPDGIPEINLFPGGGDDQLPPGNFGTIDIGSPDNKTADIERQIREGVNATDLSYYPDGEFRLGSDGTLEVNGDTGLSSGMKDALESIKGQARTMPLFSTVSGPGDNAYFTLVGFAGMRIMHVKLTGSMSNKQVLVQPAITVDQAAISESGGNSYNVFRPVVLCR